MANTHIPIEIGPAARIVHAGLRCEGALKGILKEERISLPEFAILLHIAKSSRPIRLGELAAVSQCTPTYVGRVILYLFDEGLVDTSTDGIDSRATLVSLSPLGRPLIKQVLARIEEFQRNELPNLIAEFSVQVRDESKHEVFQVG